MARFGTTQLVAGGVAVQDLLGSSTEVTVYSVKGPPLAGSFQETVAWPLPAVAAGFCGAEGTGAMDTATGAL